VSGFKVSDTSGYGLTNGTMAGTVAIIGRRADEGLGKERRSGNHGSGGLDVTSTLTDSDFCFAVLYTL
jgi:hypothetical protein